MPIPFVVWMDQAPFHDVEFLRVSVPVECDHMATMIVENDFANGRLVVTSGVLLLIPLLPLLRREVFTKIRWVS